MSHQNYFNDTNEIIFEKLLLVVSYNNFLNINTRKIYKGKRFKNLTHIETR